ncbi:hypothetical protein GH714_028393 [Hevea brasiliensis]|uniref:Plant bHLH transcription factor ACT-like domain-containing protein n=1 Tax=Hevea brasiliensis TaxID=3981 RepID=A0A6A6MER4_HEVBR|nr:hypothetical protein GH714_028393 [Hevea brasiliensis]
MSDSFSDFLEEPEFADTNLDGDDLFAIFESLDSVTEFPPVTPSDEVVVSSKKREERTRLVSQKSSSSSALLESETEIETSPKSKRQKTTAASSEEVGDQASIIGGVVDYINELQQVLQSLEAKKQRKVYSEVLSPRLVSSPRPSPLSPRKPPLSPRLNLPISPRTPQPGSPYRPRLQQGYLSPTMVSSLEPSPTSSSSSINDNINELVANSKSAIAAVEVKFSGPNVLLKTVSPRIPGQAVKIISALEDLSLEILQVSMNTVDETMLKSFTIKIGIECQLSAEELAQQIQQTFC